MLNFKNLKLYYKWMRCSFSKKRA